MKHKVSLHGEMQDVRETFLARQIKYKEGMIHRYKVLNVFLPQASLCEKGTLLL